MPTSSSQNSFFARAFSMVRQERITIVGQARRSVITPSLQWFIHYKYAAESNVSGGLSRGFNDRFHSDFLGV